MSYSDSALLDRLRIAVAKRHVTQSLIALQTGVDQSQISRILTGKNKRASENVQKLCKFASLLPDHSANPDRPENEAYELLAALLEGSPETRQGVVALMRNLLTLKKEYERDARNST